MQIQNDNNQSEVQRLGLVLEGGGMRGMFTCGVIDQLMDHGITFDGAAGVSAGACFGVNIKSGQRGRAVRYQLAMVGNKEYMSIRSLLRTGNLVNADYAYHVVPMQIDVFDIEAADRSPMEFIVVCTDVKTGRPVYHPLERVDYDELEWIRASASLPLVAQPVHVDGHVLLDGGLSDSIPLQYMQQRGYQRNIVVLTQPLGYRKPATSHLWAWRWATRKYLQVLECLRQRPEVYNRQLDYCLQQAASGNTLLIAPDATLKIGRLQLEADRIQAVYDSGREVAEKMMPQILDFVGQ